MSSGDPEESDRPFSHGYTSANEDSNEDSYKFISLDPSIPGFKNSSRLISPISTSPGRGNLSTSPPVSKTRRHSIRSNEEIQDPFDNTNVQTYSHKPNIVPPYVLDGLSQVHYKDQLDNTNTNANETINPITRRKSYRSNQIAPSQTSQQQVDDDVQYLSFSNDPFIKSLGANKWQNFLSTIQQPTAYTSDLVKYDAHYDKTDTQLNASWGGDDRLKLALLGTPSSDEDTYVGDESGSLLSKLFGFKGHKKKSGSKDNDAPKVRSQAGYWMSDEKRADVLPFLNRLFVQNPLVPLFLRILIIFSSVIALALACSIFVFSRRPYDETYVEQQPSTIMAIVVQCCAIVYVIYIAYDEYSGKPLGLRNPLGKMKLIMLDLLFIIFSAANLSLTFNTLYDDEWVCQEDTTPSVGTGILHPRVHSICRRQRALASFLFVVLCLWVLTFTISIVRVVDRVSVGSPRND